MLVSGAILGVFAGLAVSRDWRRLATLHIRWFPLLVAGLLTRAAAPYLGPAAFPLYLLSLASTALAAAANVKLKPAWLVALGAVLNLAVVLLNHGMPVDADALSVAAARMPTDGLHLPVTSSTILTGLADIIPLTLFHSVYSVGDFAVAAGGFLLPFIILTRR